MLATCEEFAAENNLKFSTDPDPKKSKTKCIYMCGKSKMFQYPVSLQLYGVDLPWVDNAVHLGHELHQLGTMEHDAKVKRAIFIQNSTDIREMFEFAPGWDNNGKPGNQVATKSLPSSEIFGKNPAFIIIYVNLIY